MTETFLIDLLIKYVLAFLMANIVTQVIDAILWAGNIGINKINLDSVINTFDDLDNLGGKGWIQKNIIKLIGIFVNWIALISTGVLTFFRYLELYILKAISPLLIVFMMSDHTRSISITVLKQAGAIALQGVLIVIILMVYPAFSLDEILKVEKGGNFIETWGPAMLALSKGIIFILLIFGSQRKAKSLMNVQ